MKKKLHISSNNTEHLERELKQLKEEHLNLTMDYQQLKNDHEQLKNLMYTYMGGCFKY